MQLILDLGRHKIVSTAGSDDELRSITGKRSPVGIVGIKVVQDNVVVQEAVPDLLLKFVAKQRAEYDQTPQVTTDAFVWVPARTQYEANVNWITDTLNDLFGVQSDPVDVLSGDEVTNVIQTDGPHGLSVGKRIWFPSLTGGLELTAAEATKYFVQSAPTADTFTVAATSGGPAIDFTTAITAGSVRLDPADVSPVNLAIEIGWRYDSGDPWHPSENEIALELRNNYLRDTDGEPDSAAEAAALLWLKEHAPVFYEAHVLSQASKVQLQENTKLLFTALTGGGAGALDSIVTADGAVTAPSLFEVVIDGDGEYQKWLLRAGTDAEDGVSIVRPDDYHGTTNAFVFARKL